MRKLLCFIFAVAMIAVAFSCNSEEEKRRLSRAEREQLRREDSAALKVGVMPTEDCLPIVVAKQLRLFDTLGVDVHLRKYRALSECRKALEDSIVEGAAIDSTLMNELNGKSPWLYSAMKTDLAWQFLTAKKARISRLDQLTDKTIAADSHGESHRLAEVAIDSLLKKKLMVFIIQVEDPHVRMDMLGNGNVDAALLPEPFASKARKQGAKVIKNVVSGAAGVVAFRTKAMQDNNRKKQYEAFAKAVALAKDSIAQYGKDKYVKLLEW